MRTYLTPSRLTIALSTALFLCISGCGDGGEMAAEAPGANDQEPGGATNADPGEANAGGNSEEPGGNDDDGGEPPPPEEEDFVVEQVAATDSYVYVPNRTEGSETVALIDGRSYSVEPITVGPEPSRVQAADVDGQGAVGYVLSRGNATVSVIRADADDGSGASNVQIRSVPAEVNDLTLAPDGEHLIAFIDPDEPINVSSSAASLQAMALLRLGDEPAGDQVFQLSVTPYIDNIIFAEDGDQAFIIGDDGIHRLWLDSVKADMVVPRLQIDSPGVDIDGDDREVVVSSDGLILAMRNGLDSAVALFELSTDGADIIDQRVVELDGPATDLELIEDGDSRELVAPIRSQSQVATIDIDAAFDADDGDDGFIEIIEVTDADLGIGRWTPDQTAMTVFSTVPERPRVGLIDMESGDVSTRQLRNQIRTLEISQDSRTAVVVHRRQEGSPGSDPEEVFRHSEGLTIWDLDTGYLRPVRLHGYPEQVIMASGDDGRDYLYVMLVPSELSGSNDQGVLRIDLSTHATRFFELPRLPNQLGAVADQIFVGQNQETGRITFFDIATGQQRTVSGYELNAGIQ